MPFGGFAELLHRVRSGTYYAGNVDLARAALTYPPLLILALIFSVVAAMSRRQPIAIAGITYGLLAISLNYTSIWVHVGNGQRGTFELFVALMLVSVSPVGSSGWLRWVRGVFWAAAAAYVFYGAFDAPSLRNALFSLVW